MDCSNNTYSEDGASSCTTCDRDITYLFSIKSNNIRDNLLESNFGASITVIGDVNSDGVDDLAVGAPLYNDTINGITGAVFILLMNVDGSILSYSQITDNEFVTNTGTSYLSDGDRFGASIASLGDLNNNGVFYIVIGAPDDSSNGFIQEGAIYILTLTSTGSLSGVYNKYVLSSLEITSNSQHFGESIAYLGDMQNNGNIQLAVGIPKYFYPSGEALTGSVVLLSITFTTQIVSYSLMIDNDIISLYGYQISDEDLFGTSVVNMNKRDVN